MQLGIIGIIGKLRRLLETQHCTIVQLAALCLVVAATANNKEDASRWHVNDIVRRASHVQCANLFPLPRVLIETGDCIYQLFFRAAAKNVKIFVVKCDNAIVDVLVKRIVCLLLPAEFVTVKQFRVRMIRVEVAKCHHVCSRCANPGALVFVVRLANISIRTQRSARCHFAAFGVEIPTARVKAEEDFV